MIKWNDGSILTINGKRIHSFEQDVQIARTNAPLRLYERLLSELELDTRQARILDRILMETVEKKTSSHGFRQSPFSGPQERKNHEEFARKSINHQARRNLADILDLTIVERSEHPDSTTIEHHLWVLKPVKPDDN